MFPRSRVEPIDSKISIINSSCLFSIFNLFQSIFFIFLYFIIIIIIISFGAFQLFWTRAITGVAIGGGMPLVFSIVGDLVGSSKRTEASGAIGISIGVGQGMGQVG